MCNVSLGVDLAHDTVSVEAADQDSDARVHGKRTVIPQLAMDTLENQGTDFEV